MKVVAMEGITKVKGLIILEDFLPKELFEKTQHTLIGPGCMFPWFFNSTKTYNDEHKTLTNFQFTHTFFDHNAEASKYYRDLIFPFFALLNPVSIIRVKANLTGVSQNFQEKTISQFHIDIPEANNKTAIYYVNSNNGKTVFPNGTEIDSVANRMVIFDGSEQHTAVSCTDQQVRCVLNFNYF
jgi:hypothetical protein